MHIAPAGLLAALLATGAAAQETRSAPSGPEQATADSAEEGTTGADRMDGFRRGPGQHRRHHVRRSRDGGPTLRVATERDGDTLRFECNAPMSDCLEALDRVLGATGRPAE